MAQYRPEALTQPRRSSRIQKAAAHRDPRAEPWFHTGCTSPQQLVDFEKGYERQRTRVDSFNNFDKTIEYSCSERGTSESKEARPITTRNTIDNSSSASNGRMIDRPILQSTTGLEVAHLRAIPTTAKSAVTNSSLAGHGGIVNPSSTFSNPSQGGSVSTLIPEAASSLMANSYLYWGLNNGSRGYYPYVPTYPLPKQSLQPSTATPYNPQNPHLWTPIASERLFDHGTEREGLYKHLAPRFPYPPPTPARIPIDPLLLSIDPFPARFT
ncbi:MAG: hypothetical protein L6R38_009383 [Xanthoria sp. 2 TBL-2021]|nr:MAG: hypothetical protein L6R38_009383 [Xanthoria sp. 2 TBL-2021]